MNIKEYLDERKKIIDEALNNFLPKQMDFPPVIYEAMSYSVSAGGKRIRPILTLASAEAVGGSYRQALPIACAIELIHTYSLIHDDLPCMDNDDLRRGIPTNHKIYGEAMAVLAGDGLLTIAFEIMIKHGRDIPSEVLLNVIEDVSRAAGPGGMVGGQAADILWEGEDISLEQLQKLQEYKTGALLVTPLRAGCMVGGGNEDELDALTSYGLKLGLAFQIADDLLDITGNEDDMGKVPGSDARKGKVTFPSLIGIERSREMAHELIDGAKKDLDIFDEKALPLRELSDYIIRRDR